MVTGMAPAGRGSGPDGDALGVFDRDANRAGPVGPQNAVGLQIGDRCGLGAEPTEDRFPGADGIGAADLADFQGWGSGHGW